jgi:hypothetical protein
MYGQTEYLDRAKKLRDTAAEVRELAVREVLIGSAEAYERMAAWLVETGQHDSARAFPISGYPVIFGFMLTVCTVAAMQLIAF